MVIVLVEYTSILWRATRYSMYGNRIVCWWHVIFLHISACKKMTKMTCRWQINRYLYCIRMNRSMIRPSDVLRGMDWLYPSQASIILSTRDYDRKHMYIIYWFITRQRAVGLLKFHPTTNTELVSSEVRRECVFSSTGFYVYLCYRIEPNIQNSV